MVHRPFPFARLAQTRRLCRLSEDLAVGFPGRSNSTSSGSTTSSVSRARFCRRSRLISASTPATSPAWRTKLSTSRYTRVRISRSGRICWRCCKKYIGRKSTRWRIILSAIFRLGWTGTAWRKPRRMPRYGWPSKIKTGSRTFRYPRHSGVRRFCVWHRCNTDDRRRASKHCGAAGRPSGRGGRTRRQNPRPAAHSGR